MIYQIYFSFLNNLRKEKLKSSFLLTPLFTKFIKMFNKNIEAKPETVQYFPFLSYI